MVESLEKARRKSQSRAKAVSVFSLPARELIKDILVENFPEEVKKELSTIKLSTVKIREAFQEALQGSKFKFAKDGKGVWRDDQRSKDPVWKAIYSRVLHQEEWVEFMRRKYKWVWAVQKVGIDPYLGRIPSHGEYLSDAYIVACALLASEEFRRAFEEGDLYRVLAMTLRFYFSTRLNIQLRLDVATSYDFVGYALARAIMNYYKYSLQNDFITLEELRKTLNMVAGAVYDKPTDTKKKKKGLIVWTEKGLDLSAICGNKVKVFVEFKEGWKEHERSMWEDNGS